MENLIEQISTSEFWITNVLIVKKKLKILILCNFLIEIFLIKEILLYK